MQDKKEILHFFKDLAEDNEKTLKESDPNAKAPTPEEMETVRKWIDAYKKKNPKATKRNANRAAIRHFNLKIQKAHTPN